ncbi:MAG: hypothetical protein H0U54_05095 [Acidobacteria bacterium]|nr:hypothetical protein [Acidobacteriota bacterium]
MSICAVVNPLFDGEDHYRHFIQEPDISGCYVAADEAMALFVYRSSLPGGVEHINLCYLAGRVSGCQSISSN